MEVRRFGLGETDVVVGGASEVVVNDNVVFGSCSDEPNRTLRFRQESTSGVDGCLITVQCLHVVVCEPYPSSFEVGGGMARQVDGQEGGKALSIADVGGRALG